MKHWAFCFLSLMIGSTSATQGIGQTTSGGLQKQLPVGSRARYRDTSIWGMYPLEVGGIGTLCTMEGMLILVLLIRRSRHKHVENTLNENKRALESTLDAQQQLTGLLLQAQDQERRRIAHDLHDVTAQSVATIKAGLNRVQRVDHPAMMTLSETVSLCDQVINELRNLSYVLHPPLLDEVGLIPALHWLVRSFNERSGTQVEIVVWDNIGRLTPEVETALFRVVEESLTSIHLYSASRIARVALVKEHGEIIVRISDNSQNMADQGRLVKNDRIFTTSIGIIGMLQRLKQLGGNVDIDSGPQGTTVTARISISEENYAAHSDCG